MSEVQLRQPEKFDIADLVSELVSLDEPSRALDQVVDIMLSGSSVRTEVSVLSVRSSKWLYSETPHYTAEMKPVESLAARRGVTLHMTRLASGAFSAEAVMPCSGRRRMASAPMATSAALAAIASVSHGG